MNYFINSFSFYFLLPAYLALALLLTFFNLPEDYYLGIFVLFAIISLPILFVALLSPLKMRMQDYYSKMAAKSYYRLVTLAFCLLIVFCGPIDIYVNGFKLLKPSTYADFYGVGRYIRHITILCWIFIPVSFLYIKSPWLKALFISYAILFPILIIDRNRFLLSCYTLFLCLALSFHESSGFIKSRLAKKLLFCLVPLGCLASFAVIGYFRSGNSFVVPSSGTSLQEGALPLAETFGHLPALLQQIVLYITTPIFNFATVVAEHFINQDFLLSQLSPFSRENFDAYPYAPIWVPRFNVGTEFYPFLLYGGLPFVAFAFSFLFLSFLLAFLLFKRFPNIFTFLIFIKISYSALFMGFAPQFYLLLNLMFVILMLCLWVFSELLKNAVAYSRRGHCLDFSS